MSIITFIKTVLLFMFSLWFLNRKKIIITNITFYMIKRVSQEIINITAWFGSSYQKLARMSL